MVVLVLGVDSCYRLEVLAGDAVLQANSEDDEIQGIGVGKER